MQLILWFTHNAGKGSVQLTDVHHTEEMFDACQHSAHETGHYIFLLHNVLHFMLKHAP
jgi:hypothetical protein